MKRTLQLKRTERNIIDAFIRLLEHKSFEKIIIQDILDEAMITRYTFYAHFKDKYDVAERIQDNIFTEIQNIFHNISFDKFEMKSFNEALQKYYETNKNSLKTIAALAEIKNENLDITKVLEHFIKKNLLINSNSPTIDQEACICANIMMCFMRYSVNNNINPCIDVNDSFYIFTDILLNVFLPIFCIIPNDENKKALLHDFAKYSEISFEK